MKYADLTDRRFGSLTALTHLSAPSRWLCRCDCGTEKVIQAAHLLAGSVNSCGCRVGKISGARVPLADRFWRLVDRRAEAECWLFLGTKNPKGYGYFSDDGKPRKTWKAHRLAFSLTNPTAPLPPVVMHSCDNPPCCNPAHLRAGTFQANAVDMFDKGRAVRARGTDHHNAKLSWDDVRAIRQDTRTQRAIAESYGVSQPLIGMIKRRVIWADPHS